MIATKKFLSSRNQSALDFSPGRQTIAEAKITAEAICIRTMG